MRQTDHQPELSTFTKAFLAMNQIPADTFRNWLFGPDMLYEAPLAWWGKAKTRSTPHEGIDVQAYRNQNDIRIDLDDSTKVPALSEGHVVQIFDDFLGRTVHIIHKRFRRDGVQLNALYGHILPDGKIQIGADISAATPIGTIASTGKRPVLPHLHLTTFWAQPDTQVSTIRWATLKNTEGVELVDPLPFIGPQYEVLYR